jgi:soluble lytic murein transglycosylase-like protein
MGWDVSLKNGFDLVCVRMETLGEKTRLYLHPATEDFLDVPSAEIVSTELVALPEGPAAPMPTSADASPNPAPTPVPPADIASLTSGAGSKYHLDPDFVASIIYVESHGNYRAVSHAGAQGLMQLMPVTAGQLGVNNSFDPSQNVEGGTQYINQLLLMYHDDLQLALAAYNAGPAAVAKYHGIPPYRETRAYVARVISEFNRRKRLAFKAAAAADKSATLVANATR